MARAMILLVSGQPMPNLLTALDPALEISNVHLIVSGDMTGRADALAPVLERRGLRVRQHMLSDVFHPDATRRIVTELVGDDPARFIVNVTGGTKIMALGAYRAAVEANVRDILYMDHEQSRLHWLDGNRPPEMCNTRLRTDEILSAHGWVADKPGGQPSDASVRAAIALHNELDTPDLLNDWNRIFYAVKGKCLVSKGKKKGTWNANPLNMLAVLTGNENDKLNALQPALACAVRHGLCTVTGRDVSVASKYDQQFLCGGWFEVAVWAALDSQRKQLRLDDVSLNARLYDGAAEAKSQRNENEFDVIARRGDRLFVFEVKTARFGGQTGPKVNDIFYRLDSLRKTFGLTARAALVSRMAVTGDPLKRFAKGGIGLIAGEAAAPDTLAAALDEWIDHP